GGVITPITSNPSPRSARSDGTAKSDVPQNRTRTRAPRPNGGGCLPSPVQWSERAITLALLVPFRERGAPLHHAEIVNEQPPVQMIDLVLQTAREEIRGIHL